MKNANGNGIVHKIANVYADGPAYADTRTHVVSIEIDSGTSNDP